MRLVLDTNILAAALIKDSLTREILLHPMMEYLIPEFALQEIGANKKEFLNKSQISEEKFQELIEKITSNLTIIPENEIIMREEAIRIMKPIDQEDAMFIALALSTQNEGIWSEDKHFEKQDKIKIWKTKELIQHLNIKH